MGLRPDSLQLLVVLIPLDGQHNARNCVCLAPFLGEKMSRSCEKCIRLWQDYLDATNKLILLTRQLDVAALCHDDEAIAGLSPQIENASRARERLREARREHEGATGHSSEDAATGK